MNFFKKILNLFKKNTEPTLWVKLKKIDERAVIPQYAHNGDVGMDMTAIDVEYDTEHDMYIYHTGLAFESNFNVGQFLFARSSNSKTEAYLTNGVGIADSAIYRGEIQFRFKNRTSCRVQQEMVYNRVAMGSFCESIKKWNGNKKEFTKTIENAYDVAQTQGNTAAEAILASIKNLDYAPYKIGDRVGQMVFMNVPTVRIEIVDELSETSRGSGGFGSTGN